MNSYDLLKPYDLDRVDQLLGTLLPDHELSFGSLVVEMMSGNVDGNFSLLWNAFKKACLYGFSESRQIFVTLLLLGILAAILQNVTGVLKGKQAMALAKYFVLLLAALSLFYGFDTALQICQATVQNLTDFMRIFLPVFCLSLGLTHGTMTAYGYYQFLFLVIYLLQEVLSHVFVPLVKCYLFLAFMNSLSNDKRFESLLRMIDKAIGRGLKILISLVLGSGMLRSVLLVKVDNVNKTVLGKAIGAIPVVGDVTDSATQMLLSCASLIKSCLGSAALVILILVCLVPLVKILFLYFSIYFSSVFLGILGEKNMMQILQQAGKGYFALFQIAFFALLTFAVTIAMMLQLTAG